MTRLLDWPVRWPTVALVASTIVTIVALVLTFRLKPETSLAGLLDPADPGVAAMAKVLNDFPVANEAMVLATLPPAASTDDTHRLNDFAERFTAAVAADDEARGLLSPPRYGPDPQTRAFVEKVVVANGLAYLDPAESAAVLERLTPAGMRRQLARNAAMLAMPGPAAGGLAKALAKDPLGLHDFLVERLGQSTPPGGGAGGGGPFYSPDRRSLLIRAGGVKSAGDYVFARRVQTTLTRLITAANTDGLRIDVAGGYAMSAHSADMIQADSVSDVVSTIVGLALLFGLASRRPLRLFTFAFVPVAMGMAWGFGAYALLYRTITPLAAVVGGTLGAIGLDYTTHFLTHFGENRRKADTAAAALLSTSHEMLRPSLAAWMTSVIGFAAVGVSPVRVLRDFAVLGTLCLIGAWLSTLVVLPAMLVRFGPTGPTPFEGRFGSDRRVFDWIDRHARGLLVVAGVLVGGLVVATLVRGPHVETESDPMILHPRPSPPLAAQRFIAERMGTAAGGLLVHLQAESPPALVRLAYAVHGRLDTATVRQAGVTGSFGLNALLPRPHDREDIDALPESDPKRADTVDADFRAALVDSGFTPGGYDGYVALLRTLVTPRPPPGVEALSAYPELGQLLLPRPDDAASVQLPAQAVTLVFTSVPLETRDAREAALSAVRGALVGVPGATVTGTAAIGNDLERAVRRDLPRFVGIALVCIAAYLLIHLRSAASAAFALLPIAVSLVVVVACFCLAGVKLNLLHTVAAPLLLGINLDYGIFALHAWRDAKSRDELAKHFTPALSGLLICGGATVIGFGSLVITSVPAVRSLGWLINIGVVSCVAATLAVQWPAMLLARRGPVPSPGTPGEG